MSCRSYAVGYSTTAARPLLLGAISRPTAPDTRRANRYNGLAAATTARRNVAAWENAAGRRSNGGGGGGAWAVASGAGRGCGERRERARPAAHHPSPTLPLPPTGPLPPVRA